MLMVSTSKSVLPNYCLLRQYDHREDKARFNVDDYEYVNCAAKPEFADTVKMLREMLLTEVAKWQRT